MAKQLKVRDTSKRVADYLGPDDELTPDALDEMEKTGLYLFQPKIDGMWASLTVSAAGNVLKSRDARTPPVSGSNAGDLLTASLPLADGSIVVGELEAASQWATARFNESKGIRRMHLFDALVIDGRDLRDCNTLARYDALERWYNERVKRDPFLAFRFKLVPSYRDRFRERYDQLIADGYEGCVLKSLVSKYETTRSDGKRSDWFRCKKFLTDDFVLIGIGMTKGGKYAPPQETGIWGLWDPRLKQFVEVFRSRSSVPDGVICEANVGRYVAEWGGWERFASGALRHAQHVRRRLDKPADACIPRVAW